MDDHEIGPKALEQMRERGGTWAVYQNQALDSKLAGHLQFLKYGLLCTYLEPPNSYPADTQCGPGWRYLFIGTVDLESGKVIPVEKADAAG